MSTLQTIRGALQTTAAAAAGFPSADNIAYEGRGYVPVQGTPYAKLTMIPVSRRPFDVAALVKGNLGLFQVDLFFPSQGSPGTAAIEAAGDAVVAALDPATFPLYHGGLRIEIDYAERIGAILESAQWLQAIVNARWRCYSS